MTVIESSIFLIFKTITLEESIIFLQVLQL